MIYRNEIKNVIDAGDKAAISANFRAAARLDEHAGPSGSYHVRRLCFDNPVYRALREKLDGVNEREKFRMRYYNGDTLRIHLEKKVKRGGLGYKVSEPLTDVEGRKSLTAISAGCLSADAG